MTPEQIERVFGRGRLQMVTGEHVEVFREAVAPGERRRYTKRFLNTHDGDFGQWTEREWRILARLIGHGIGCVPEVVQFDRGRVDGIHLVQTYDAGVTVDQWATLLPVKRDGRTYRHVFEDCAHWWALAHYCLQALHVIHPLELVHLDVKGDNVCIPYAPAGFDPDCPDLRLQPVFAQLALIDFAFALISRERLTTALPIGWQNDYDYQSPRLLAALEAGRSGELRLTRELDWRCDMYSLAAMLKRYLPEESEALRPHDAASWTRERYEAAKVLILRIRECHDHDLPVERPHAALIALCAERLHEDELARSLELGWTLAREATVSASASPLTPVTRLAPAAARLAAVSVTRSGRRTAVTVVPAAASRGTAPRVRVRRGLRLAAPLLLLFALCAIGSVLWLHREGARAPELDVRALSEPIRVAANQMADAARRLVWPQPSALPRDEREKRAEGATPASGGSGQPRVAASAPGPTQVASAAHTETAAEAVDRPQAPRAAPTLSPVTPPPDTSAAPHEAPATPPRPQRAQAHVPAPTAGASTQLPSRQASAAPPLPRAAKAPHAPSTAASATHLAQNQPVPQSRRSHAWWASLKPPAWLHGSGPGEPPGAKAREPYAGATITAAVTESSPPQGAAGASAAPETQVPHPAPAPPRAQTLSPIASAAAAPATTAVTTGAEAAAATTRATIAAAAGEERAADRVPAPAIAKDSDHRSSPGAEHGAPDEFFAQALQTLADAVPRMARRAEPEVARVLWMGANAFHPVQERPVAEAARSMQVTADAALLTRTTAPTEARRLSDQARSLASRQSVAEAFNAGLRAFGANPRDPDVSGNLALLYLKLAPPDADTARQLALFAIATRATLFHSARMDDWYALAAASAIRGRDLDAINAMYVMLSLSDAERGCTAGLRALAGYGERLRRPVEALFYRVQAQGRVYDAPACAWPPNWSALSRLP